MAWTAIQTVGGGPAALQEHGAPREAVRAAMGGCGGGSRSGVAGERGRGNRRWMREGERSAPGRQCGSGWESFGSRIAACRKLQNEVRPRTSDHALTSSLAHAGNQPPGQILWRSGILQKLINVALDLFHLGQEFGARSLVQ